MICELKCRKSTPAASRHTREQCIIVKMCSNCAGPDTFRPRRKSRRKSAKCPESPFLPPFPPFNEFVEVQEEGEQARKHRALPKHVRARTGLFQRVKVEIYLVNSGRHPKNQALNKMNTVTLYEEELSVMVPKSMLSARKKSITWKEVAALPLCLCLRI